MGERRGPPSFLYPSNLKLRCRTQNFRGLPVTLDPSPLGARARYGRRCLTLVVFSATQMGIANTARPTRR